MAPALGDPVGEEDVERRPTTDQVPVDAPAAARSRRLPLIASGLAVLVIAAGIALWQRPWDPREEPASVERMAFALPDRPSIAVLPFDNISDDPGQAYFADGVTEDVISDLSKNPELFVIGRNSSFSYKGQTVKVRQVAEEMGVRYVLEGEVWRADNEVRITARLIDATTGGHLWAEPYAGTLAEVFDLRHKIAQRIATTLAVDPDRTKEPKAPLAETKNPEAYDTFLRGWGHYRRGTPKDFSAAIPYFERVIQMDPNYKRAHSALAAVYWNGLWNGWTWKMGLPQQQATALARKYIRIARRKPSAFAYRLGSEFSAQFLPRPRRALGDATRSIALDANDPAGYLAMANALVKAGRPEEAVENVNTAMRLDPHYPASYMTRLGRAYFAMKRFEDAAETFERAVARDPDSDWSHVYLAASYGQLGYGDKAKAAVERANELRARWGWDALSLQALDQDIFRWTGDRTDLREGLVKAGVQADDLDWMALVASNQSGYEVEGATIVDVETAKAMHDRGVPFVDVDVRWMVGHIPKAVSLEVGTGEFNKVRLAEITKEHQEIVIYGTEGSARAGPRTAAHASALAVSWGFEKVYYLAGGIGGWKKAGHPVETP